MPKLTTLKFTATATSELDFRLFIQSSFDKWYLTQYKRIDSDRYSVFLSIKDLEENIFELAKNITEFQNEVADVVYSFRWEIEQVEIPDFSNFEIEPKKDDKMDALIGVLIPIVENLSERFPNKSYH